jgi:hypothetical protein
VWNIVIDATSGSMTKTSRLAIREAVCNYIVLITASSPKLATSLMMSVTTIFSDGFTVLHKTTTIY